MRLFLALDFPEGIKERLFSAAALLRKNAEHGSITRKENFHLTLAFLGEVPPQRIPALKEVMTAVSAPSFSLFISSIGCFHRPQGDLYWAGVESEPFLTELQQELLKCLNEAGFSIEAQKFVPHVTLGRGIYGISPVLQNPSGLLPSMKLQIRAFSLMQSARVNGILTYTELHRQLLKE